MRTGVVMLLGLALVASRDVRAEAAPEWKTAYLLEGTAGLVTGVLVTGYAAYAADKLELTNRTTRSFVALPFALAAGAGVWLGGRIGGIEGDALSTVLASILPGVLALGFFAALDDRDADFLSVFTVPLVSLGGALLGFELSRDPVPSSVRRAVADERSP